MSLLQSTGSSRVAMATKAVIRHMKAADLKEGDSLPTQQELRQILGFSNDTLTAAMRQLVEAGALTRRSRRGTLVVDPDPSLRGLWSVALGVQPRQVMLETPFFAQLAQALQGELSQSGVRCQTYTLPLLTGGGRPRMTDFPGLDQDVAGDAVDAVVVTPWMDENDWAKLVAAGIPVIHVGSWERAPCGVYIDQGPMVSEMTRELLDAGCKQIGIVNRYPLGEGSIQWEAFVEATRSSPSVRSEPAQFVGKGNGVLAGQKVGEELLSMPAAQRPDGLMVLDDWVAMGLCAALAQDPSYRPRIAVQTNLQAPVAFALPVRRYEVDVHQLGEMGVQMVLQRLLDPTLPEDREAYVPHRSLGEASEYPTARAEEGVTAVTPNS